MSHRKPQNQTKSNKENQPQKNGLQKLSWNKGLQGVPVLQLTPSNFMEWKRSLQEYLYKNNGRFGHIVEFGEHAEFPMPQAPQPDENGDIADVDRISYETRVSETAKFQARYQNEYPTVYTKIWTSISVACQEKCKESDEYADINLHKEPHGLYGLILSQCTGHQGIEQLSAKARVDARKNFLKLRMLPHESVQEYKLRFENELELLEAYHVEMGDPEDLAATFVDSLDDRRFGAFKQALWNEASSGAAAYPESIHDAARRADHFKGGESRQSSEPLPVAMLTTEAKKNGSNKGRAAAAPRQASAPDKSTTNGHPCGLCGLRGHLTWKCPQLAVAKEALQRSGHIVANGQDVDATCDECGGDLPNECVCAQQGPGGGGRVNGNKKKPKKKSAGYTIRATVHVAESASTDKTITEDHVLMDNQAPLSIFSNPRLLTNIRKAVEPCEFSGIGNGVILAKMCGDFGVYGTVYLNLKAGVNVLGWDEIEQRCKASFYYDNTERELHVSIADITHVYCRLPCGLRGMLASENTRTQSTVYTATVSGMRRLFSHRENVNADAARELIRAIGVPSTAAVKQIVNSGAVTHLNITAKDIDNAVTIHGADLAGAMKGKSTEPDDVAVPVERIERMIDVNIHLFVDLMFIAGYGFMVAVAKPIGLITTVLLGRKGNLKTESKLRGAVLSIVSEIKSERFVISSIRFDGEKGLGPLITTVQGLGIKAIQLPGSHTADIEIVIKLIKNWVRGIAHSRAFKVAIPLYVPLVYFVIGRLNLIPSKRGYPNVPAIEVFRGRKVNFKLDIRIGFGEYCQVVTPNLGLLKSDTTVPRSEGAISLYSKGNASGGIVFLLLRSLKYVTRTKFQHIPMPIEVVQLLNAWASSVEAKTGAIVEEDPTDGEAITIESSAVEQTGDLLDVNTQPPTLKPQMIQEDHELIPDSEVIPLQTASETNGVSIDPFARAQDMPEIEQYTSPIDASLEDDAIAVTNVNSFADEHGVPRPSPVIDNDARRSSERVRLKPTIDYAALAGMSAGKRIKAYKISVKRALRDMKLEALQAIIKELLQMLTLDVFEPVLLETLTAKDLRRIIRSSMFLKEKYKANGVFDKLKARLVAGGDQQDRSLYGDVYSPTAGTPSVFITAGIAAKEDRHVVSCDIGGAYLKARMPPGSKVLMRLDHVQSAILIALDSKYRRFLNKDGTIVVRLKSALYGCIESAKLWFTELSGVLISQGFVPNPLDKCVFNKGRGDQQITIVVYVDDLLITSCSESEIEVLKQFLVTKFGDVTFNYGVQHSYLGMIFKFQSGRVDISMPGFTNDLLEAAEVHGQAKTPAAVNLFDIDETSASLPDDMRETFHSLVAKCLYMAKRTRPDILLAVSFLASRVTKSTQEDWVKLRRLLNYINTTKQLGISLTSTNEFQARESIDAAYGVHHDGKSQSGSTVSIGRGPVHSRSAKQQIVVKSSFEAELVAASDEASQVMWTHEFLVHQGYDHLSPPVIEQDNQGTILTLNRGGSASHRSRHIKVRYFWLHDHIKRNEVVLVYVPTDELVGDILTKPLQGTKFLLLRDKLLNWQGS